MAGRGSLTASLIISLAQVGRGTPGAGGRQEIVIEKSKQNIQSLHTSLSISS